MTDTISIGRPPKRPPSGDLASRVSGGPMRFVFFGSWP